MKWPILGNRFLSWARPGIEMVNREKEIGGKIDIMEGASNVG
jgi:hypothetical protein